MWNSKYFSSDIDIDSKIRDPSIYFLEPVQCSPQINPKMLKKWFEDTNFALIEHAIKLNTVRRLGTEPAGCMVTSPEIFI